ncbi:MAG: succinylglutamate desuccinylase [Cytophagales bacterium]|nr:MAG: succinylglutamate desuccinylase [Cytophagales bacterium]
MDKDIIEIAGISIARGEEKEINIPITNLPTRTPIEIPMLVSRGESEGPSLLVTAGMHGDEINGIEIVRRFIRDGYAKPNIGTVLCIPILNVYGFINFSRDVTEGKDINRSFPGSKTGSLASRVAHAIMKYIIPEIDFGIDFHTGGAARSNYPQIRCVYDLEKNLELANYFAAPFTLNSDFIAGSFRHEAHLQGKPILVFEGGESLRFDEDVIQEGINGLRRLMDKFSMSNNSPQARHVTRKLTTSTWVRAESAGLFHFFANNGSNVTEGQTIGIITDPFGFGDFEVEVKAKTTGHIICVNNVPVVHQGDPLVHIGVEG